MRKAEWLRRWRIDAAGCSMLFWSRMSAPAQPMPPEFLTRDTLDQFFADNRAAVRLAAVLQTDFFAASDRMVETKFAGPDVRAMVHCFGSLIDGLSTAMRQVAISTCKLFGKPLNPFLQEKVEERTLSNHQRIYTSYRLIGEFLPGSPLAKAADELWSELHVAIEIRNRVVHPRCVADTEVTPGDAMRVAEVGDEFSRHANQFAQWLVQKEQKLIQPYLVEARHYSKIPRNAPCPCGSGKKYKHCCIAAAYAA